MREGLNELFYGVSLPRIEDADERSEEESSFYGDSVESISSSTSDLTDDATSPTPPMSNASQVDENGPLYELSSLMEDLPIRKGISKYYRGKSQSFSCLSDARCIGDLAKKGNPYKKRMKTCKSYAGGLNAQKPTFAPGPRGKTISKKPSRVSCASLLSKRSSSKWAFVQQQNTCHTQFISTCSDV